MTPPATLSLTPKTGDVLQYATREAGRLRAPEVEPAHLLLGMIRQGDCFGALALRSWGADPALVARELEPLGRPDRAGAVGVAIPRSARLEALLLRADELRRRISHRQLGTDHLLLVLVMDEETPEAAILARHAILAETVRRLLAMRERGEPVTGEPLLEARFAQALLRAGHTDALRLLAARRRTEGIRSALVDSGEIEEDTFLRLLREESGFLAYDGTSMPDASLLPDFPEELARDMELLPFDRAGGRVRMLCLDPFLSTQHRLLEDFGPAIEWIPVRRAELEAAIDRAFG